MHQFYTENYQFCPRCQAKLKLESEPGSNSERLHCPQCQFNIYANPTPSVAAVLTRIQAGKQQLLLAKRGIEPFLGWWDLPGGFINSGETASQAVRRELKEETQLTVQVQAYLGAYPDIYQDEPTLTLGFLTEIKSGQPQPQDDVAELRWFNQEQLPDKIAFAAVRQIIKKTMTKEQL